MDITYFLAFGSGNPASFSGILPTFTVFVGESSGAISPPAISEVSTTGFYRFSYEAEEKVAFIIDGVTSSLSSAQRYVVGEVTPYDSVLGSPASSIGGVSVFPGDIYGIVSRVSNWLEGQANFNKSTGIWSAYDRSGATLLSSRVLTDATSGVTKI